MAMQTRLRVADLMTVNVQTIGENDMLYDAIRKMETESMSALPVVNSDGKLCGILSSSDLLQLTYNIQCDVSVLVVVSDLVRKTLTDVLAKDNCDVRAGSAMTSNVATISANASIVEAASSLINNDVHHLPVVDPSGVPIGIVSTMDIVRAVAFDTGT